MALRPTLGGLSVVLLTAVSGAAADVEKGKTLYTACLVCHTEKPDALGPSLKGVYGRRSAALEDFRYSNPMKRANLTWDEANLRAYIADPQGKVKGNRMPFGGVPSTNDVDDLVAFLKTYK
jgi:cytochrome c